MGTLSRWRRWWTALLFALVVSGRSIAAPVEAAAIPVVVTIHPLSSIVKAVGGPLVRVETLLPPGASPHTFEPRPAHVRAVAEAQLVVAVGAGLDDWVLAIARSAKDAGILLASEHVIAAGMGRAFDDHEHDDTHGHSHGDIDPHVWLDPMVVKEAIAPAIAEALIQALPEHRRAIESHLQRFQQELDQLDAWIRERLASVGTGAFISYHAAWGYFADRYGLEHAASVAGFPGQEPSARWIAQVVQLARERGIKVVFAEPQLSPKAAETIAREIQGQVLLLDPLGGHGLAGRENYIDLMRYNTEMLVQAFALTQ